MKRPFISLCISLLIGIVGAYLLNYSISIYYVLYATIIALVVLLFYERVFAIFILLTVVTLGAYLYGQSIAGDILLNSAPLNTVINVKVLKEGSVKKGFSEYEVEILSLSTDKINKNVKVNKNAQLKIYQSLGRESVLNVDDIIEIDNTRVIKLLQNMNVGKSNSYELFLKSKGIEYILEVNSENIKFNSNSYCKPIGIRHISYRMKIYLEDFLDSTLDFENSNILKSIVFGNQGYLSKDKLSVFSKTGTAHIMAVSGLHVGLIVIVVDRFLKLIKIARNNRLYFIVAILIFYAYMVYFPVSIVRAGIMYILYVIAYFLQRRYDGINALFFIAFILLIYRPMTIFSISFQLSFIATLSILLLNPIFNEKLSKKIGFVGTLLSVTLAAQIGTLPIMAYHFKQISIISLLTNLLIVPILGPMLSIVFVSVLFGTISFRLGYLINQITNQLLNYINWISTKCAIIPYGSFEINEVKLTYIFGYYIILAIIYFIYKQKEKSNFKEEGLVNTYEL
ncbi:ComEC/Rec2 family competence protein [Alkaliphilus sp. B6464]|uniref:ComEC/Rec2 family competence protein n=1 Tax=Alkaliphilus sp. B6464 TaxID=2731219 RepID=UPI001BA4970D|nr:ComEC/Rec2 family competence protein [Alkaliphilus sp. B6464]QUH21129.1 ComEC/Rec2 family competence protein [Alkaliphilus sp. B6464]